MNTRKWFSNMTTLLAVLITLALTVGLVQAQGPEPPQEPVESVNSVQTDGPDGPARIESNTYGFLAIGVPDEDEGATDAGATNVIYGSAGGLSSTNNQLWHQDSTGILGGAEDNDFFGRALAVGDFDSDGNLDLAIGVPNEDYGATDNGVVHILYGANGLLSSTDNQLWRQSDLFGAGTDGDYDRFGSALAVGDFDGDGYEDLAVGAKTEQVGDDPNAGTVSIIYGSASGLTATDAQFWHQGIGSIVDNPENGDQFGFALASADFDGDGYDDLAVGVPYEDVHDGALKEGAGAVIVIYGSASGLTSTGNQWLAQNLPGLLNSCQPNDNLGYSLAAGNFNGDGYADLAFGVPNEYIVDADQAGAVHVVYGSASGLSVDEDQFWHQQYTALDDDPETGDRFGYALTAGDFNRDGLDDLVVGVPYEGITSAPEKANAGVVHFLFGTSSGLTDQGSLRFHQDSVDIIDTSEANDHFGKTLAAGDFDGDGYTDLAVGVPDEDVAIYMNTIVDAGAVNVIYGSASGPTAVGNQCWHQNASGIEDSVGTSENFGYALAAYYRVKTNLVYLPLILR